MKVESVIPAFTPFSISITFESLEEAQSFYTLFNNSGILDITKLNKDTSEDDPASLIRNAMDDAYTGTSELHSTIIHAALNKALGYKV